MKVFAPAKLNLFLKIKGKRPDGYHIIRTGVTFIDLYDEIDVDLTKETSIMYHGRFAPESGHFENDIIHKTIDYINKLYKKDIFLSVVIKKNIPTGAGLGSGSVDAAALIRALNSFGIIDDSIDHKKLSLIGADINMCLDSKDCIVTGIGEKVARTEKFLQYCFVLIKPNLSFSTKQIYSNFKFENIRLNKEGFYNDLECTAIHMYPKIGILLEDLSKLNGSKFSRMTGSGSCCYAAFTNNLLAEEGFRKISKKYPEWWSVIAKNIFVN